MNWLALALITLQPQVQQFDLVCSGSVHALSQFTDRTDPYSYHYRVDLSEGKWCEGDCGVLREFVEVQPAILVLTRSSEYSQVLGRREITNTIDRVTGRHSIASASGGSGTLLTMNWQGQCERRPFSGFPVIQTRF